MLNLFTRARARIQKILRQMRPAQIIVLVFALLILAGALLLSLPVSAASGKPTPFLTCLFTATSATCVTGLIQVDTGTYWSTFGQVVILILIQLGGLGFMTVSTIFFLALRRRIGLKQRMVLARIRAAIRHTRTPAGSEAVANTGIFRAGDLTIDYAKHRVFVSGQDANLTQNEYKLVALLGLHAGKVLTYDYLIRELWGPSARSDNQILRVNMANIRRKIEQNPAQPVYIYTEVGIGYRMIEGD